MTKKRPTIHAYFGTEAEEYGQSAWMRRNQQKTTRKCLDLLESEEIGGPLEKLPEELIVLDIGCGTGYSSEVLLERGFRVIGIDISPDMLYQAPERANFHKILADMRHIPIRPEHIDHVISISAFNFASEGGRGIRAFSEGIHKAVNELYRVLKKFGRAVIEFYPTEKEEEFFLKELKKLSFNGGLLIENRGTRKERKMLLLEKS